ncbi:DcaP family trimeric outer membrane transporter [Porphyrobacter sp. TH134]|uniref:DcaP family trimeric outer membrane transporter n=1 Tax=Porphyrobacter sp. TH134 TaxID=2067450 RepID=UPI001F2303CF|nr:DcaP family trimeric outer membrane transporter [Porphyrobacter sp. TH134]
MSARLGLRAALLAATALSAAPALAQEASVDERLDRLELLVEGLIARIDAGTGAQAQQAEALAAIRTETGAIRAEQQAMRAEAQATEATTRTLAARQAEMSDKLIDFAIAPGEGFRMGKTRVTYGGYVKLDATSQRTSGGQIAGNSILRDFLFPSSIPVGGSPSGFDTDFSARQTRFLFKTETDVGTDHKLSSLIELDFNVTEGGNERVTNSFTPRIRHALINYDNWTFGQGWSTFQNVGALPDSLDFIGVTPGTVFDRQPLIRYTKGGLQIALEQPETVVTTQTGGMVTPGDDQLPDIIGRYNWSGEWGSFTAAGIVRQLHVSTDDLMGVDDAAWGYGLSLSGKLKVGEKDDLRFMATAGDGLGRYIGLNIVNDAAVRRDGTLDPIFTWSGFAAYRHLWSDRVRSNLGGSYFKADNPVRLTTNQVTDESWNAFVNLIWAPVGPLNVGLELMYAQRTLEDGRSGNLQRVQVSTQYNF